MRYWLAVTALATQQLTLQTAAEDIRNQPTISRAIHLNMSAQVQKDGKRLTLDAVVSNDVSSVVKLDISAHLVRGHCHPILFVLGFGIQLNGVPVRSNNTINGRLHHHYQENMN